MRESTPNQMELIEWNQPKDAGFNGWVCMGWMDGKKKKYAATSGLG